MTAVQLSKTHRMRSCYGRTVILLSSRHPRLLEPEKRFALDLCWSSSIQKQYNPLHMFCRKNHSAWHSQCKSNRFWTKKKKVQKSVTCCFFVKKENAHPHVVVCSILLSISVQIGGALKVLFPPAIYFLFPSCCFFVCFLDESSSSEARCGMYEGWKLLVFFPHESNDHWSSPQRTHRHHQVTQSTKRRAQLSTRRTYLFPLRQHASLARIHGHLCHRHRGNALK